MGSFLPGNTSGVDPRLVAIIKAAAEASPYTVKITSGKRAFNPARPTPNHPGGWATDINLSKDGGKTWLSQKLHSKDTPTFQDFATRYVRPTQRQMHPELNRYLRWGGWFGGKYAGDVEHFDITPKFHGGMGKGEWADGPLGPPVPPEDIPNVAQPPTAQGRQMPLGMGRNQIKSGPAVAKLQQQLADAGFNPGTVDGVFGPRTAAAVRAAQAKYGIGVDGVAGPATQSALELASHPAYAPGGAGSLADVYAEGGPTRPPNPPAWSGGGSMPAPGGVPAAPSSDPGSSALETAMAPSGIGQMGAPPPMGMGQPYSPPSIYPDPNTFAEARRHQEQGAVPMDETLPAQVPGGPPDLTHAQLGLTNAESRMWDAFKGNPALAEAYKQGLGGSGSPSAPAPGGPSFDMGRFASEPNPGGFDMARFASEPNAGGMTPIPPPDNGPGGIGSISSIMSNPWGMGDIFGWGSGGAALASAKPPIPPAVPPGGFGDRYGPGAGLSAPAYSMPPPTTFSGSGGDDYLRGSMMGGGAMARSAPPSPAPYYQDMVDPDLTYHSGITMQPAPQVFPHRSEGGGFQADPQPSYQDWQGAPGWGPATGYHQATNASFADFLQSPTAGPPLPASVVGGASSAWAAPTYQPGNPMNQGPFHSDAVPMAPMSDPTMGLQPPGGPSPSMYPAPMMNSGMAPDLGPAMSMDYATPQSVYTPPRPVSINGSLEKQAADAWQQITPQGVTGASPLGYSAPAPYAATGGGYSGGGSSGSGSGNYGQSPGSYTYAGKTQWGSPQYFTGSSFSNSSYTPAGYTAPNFDKGSGGNLYAYQPNGQGGGTYVDSHGDVHNY